MTGHRSGYRPVHRPAYSGETTSPQGLRRAAASLRQGVLEWFWVRYHERRHLKLAEVFHTVFISDDEFVRALDRLDEFQRWDLSMMIEGRLRSCRATDRNPALSAVERERLQRQYGLLVARLERGCALLAERLMRDLQDPPSR